MPSRPPSEGFAPSQSERSESSERCERIEQHRPVRSRLHLPLLAALILSGTAALPSATTQHGTVRQSPPQQSPTQQSPAPTAPQSPSAIATTEPGGGLVARAFYPDDDERHPAVLLIGGSGGGMGWQEEHARLLAERGFAALAVAYFGLEGLPDELERIPIEYFEHALTWLRLQPFVDPERLGVVGVSKGGELALLLASRRPELSAVVAFVPSSHVFQSVAEGYPSTSSWSLGGQELPFVAYGTFDPDQGIVSVYRSGLETATNLEQAAIPVEQIGGPVLLLTGEADNLWPSADFGRRIERRLADHGFPHAVRHVAYPDAGHLISSIREESVVRRGGSDGGNSRAQREAQREMIDFLMRSLGRSRTPSAPSSAAEHSAAAEVQAARARFNDAIRARDLDTIRALHAPEYHLITGRSSQFHGTEAHLALWQQSFANDPPDLYVRTPREVRVHEEWGLAEELGDWRGTYTVTHTDTNGTTADSTRAEAWGVYAAKWQRAEEGGGWRLQSEVFTTLGCSGPADGCRPPDPVN